MLGNALYMCQPNIFVCGVHEYLPLSQKTRHHPRSEIHEIQSGISLLIYAFRQNTTIYKQTAIQTHRTYGMNKVLTRFRSFNSHKFVFQVVILIKNK